MEGLSNRLILLRVPLASLCDSDEVQNHKQRHGEGWNQAHWEHGHGVSCDAVWVDEPRSYAHANCSDQVSNPEQMPEHKTLPKSWIGKVDGNEWCRTPYRDISPACGQR